MKETIKAAIVGASGYGAGEILRLLLGHPQVTVTHLISSSAEGTAIESLHPQLTGSVKNLLCTGDLVTASAAGGEKPSVIFCALPHGASGNYALSLLRNPAFSEARIIDLSGDLRMREESLAGQWYPETDFVPQERNSIVYGLPELNREAIRSARLVANPGCLASAAILALAPLASSSSLSGEIVIDAKTGTSGAGRNPQPAFHHPGMHSNSFAYKVLEHRHEAEIREILGDPFEKHFSTLFVPHVIPASRGIYVTCYLPLPQGHSLDSLRLSYRTFYAASPFVQVIEQIPELRSVVGSNFCQISLRTRGNRLVVVAALDNLLKGMAGSAVQNMNLMFGCDEKLGLTAPALGII